MRDWTGDPRLATLQAKLNLLFESVRPVGKARYSVREVSDAIKRDQGIYISGAYINQLCNGRRDNPGVQQVQALARFFGVPVPFLVGDGDVNAVAEQLQLLSTAIAAKERLQAADDAMKDPQVRYIAVKARGLSASHLDIVAAVLDKVRSLEGLDHVAPDDES